MDNIEECTIPKCSAVPDLRSLSVVVGMKQLRKVLLKGTARYVFLAQDADPAITEPIAQLCRELRVDYAWTETKQKLGEACGIEVGASAAAVLRECDSIG